MGLCERSDLQTVVEPMVVSQDRSDHCGAAAASVEWAYAAPELATGPSPVPPPVDATGPSPVAASVTISLKKRMGVLNCLGGNIYTGSPLSGVSSLH